MKRRMISRIAFGISIATLSFLGTAPIGVEGSDQADTNQVYMALVMQSFVPVDVTYHWCSFKGSPYSIVGRITNNTNQTIYNTRLTAQFFNKNGDLIYTLISTGYLPATFPGGTNPFEMSPPWELRLDPYSHEVVVSIDSYDIENDPEYLPLTVVSKNFDEYGDEPNWWGILSGEIRNDNLDTIEDILVYVNGSTICGFTRVDPIASTLAPSETTFYSVEISLPRYQVGEDFTLWAQGAVAP